MTRYLRILTMLVALVSALSGHAQVICDMQAAREWCDDAMLSSVEGIWEYPDDHTSVLIRCSRESKSKYDIIVVESPDTRLIPGETIGFLQRYASPSKFEMGLYRDKRTGILGDLGKCLAEYNERDASIIVTSPSAKLRLRSAWFLPAFWRAVKLSVSNPVEKLPKGMIRIYPPQPSTDPDWL